MAKIKDGLIWHSRQDKNEMFVVFMLIEPKEARRHTGDNEHEEMVKEFEWF